MKKYHVILSDSNGGITNILTNMEKENIFCLYDWVKEELKNGFSIEVINAHGVLLNDFDGVSFVRYGDKVKTYKRFKNALNFLERLED